MEEKELLKELEEKLKHHDWYYIMSDDYHHKINGRKSVEEIRELRSQIGWAKTQHLFNKYAPNDERAI